MAYLQFLIIPIFYLLPHFPFIWEEQISVTNSTVEFWIAHFLWKVIKVTSWEEPSGEFGLPNLYEGHFKAYSPVIWRDLF